MQVYWLPTALSLRLFRYRQTQQPAYSRADREFTTHSGAALPRSRSLLALHRAPPHSYNASREPLAQHLLSAINVTSLAQVAPSLSPTGTADS
eukprot:gene8152-7508_t